MKRVCGRPGSSNEWLSFFLDCLPVPRRGLLYSSRKRGRCSRVRGMDQEELSLIADAVRDWISLG